VTKQYLRTKLRRPFPDMLIELQGETTTGYERIDFVEAMVFDL